MQYNNQPNRYGNSGALWERDKRSTNSPDRGGEFTISDDVLDYVLQQARNGEVKLEISGWDKIGNESGDAFISLKINIPWKVRQGQEEQGQSRQQRPPQRGGYSQQSGRADFRDERQRDRREEPRPVRGANVPGRGRAPMSDREFSRGDRMPSFNLDDDDDSPPFDR